MRTINEQLLKDIYLDINNDPYITQKDLAIKYDLTERTIRRYFFILKKNNNIERVGKGKDKCWVIK